MTLTKEAITRSIFDRLDLSKSASANAVEATEIIKNTIENGVRNIYTVKTTLFEISKQANGVKHVFWKYIKPIPKPTII